LTGQESKKTRGGGGGGGGGAGGGGWWVRGGGGGGGGLGFQLEGYFSWSTDGEECRGNRTFSVSSKNHMGGEIDL